MKLSINCFKYRALKVTPFYIYTSSFLLANATGNLDKFVFGPTINQTDRCFVAFFKKKMLTPPRSPGSVKTIPFSRKEVDVPSNIEKLKWVQMLVIDGSPKNTQFFFVESGAHDGRFLSSTLRLETLFGWNGVLIEPQPKEFKKILKNRRVWAVNAALCVTSHPDYIDFYVQNFTAESGPELDAKRSKSKIKPKLPCVPLYTILKALKVDVVDYLSLDIEGAELKVLKTVPFDKVKFKVMTIEYNHLPGRNQIGQLKEFLEPKGYRMIAKIALMDNWSADCLFVHESVYRQKNSIINSLKKI